MVDLTLNLVHKIEVFLFIYNLSDSHAQILCGIFISPSAEVGVNEFYQLLSTGKAWAKQFGVGLPSGPFWTAFDSRLLNHVKTTRLYKNELLWLEQILWYLINT